MNQTTNRRTLIKAAAAAVATAGAPGLVFAQTSPKIRVGFWQDDLETNQLITAAAVLAGKTLAFQAQDLARTAARRDGQLRRH